MSAQALASREFTNNKPLAVSFRLILGLYSIIPVCLLLSFLDELLWGEYLQEHLPSSPNHFVLFQILFGTPHILASAILLVTNADYLKIYQRKIMGMTVLLALVFGLGSLFIPYKVFYVTVAAWTVFHVLKQQHGVGRGICRLPDWAFYWLLWLSVVAGMAIYMGIFLKNSLELQQILWLKLFAGSLCVALVLSAALCQRFVLTLFGKWFLWANVFLVLSSFYLYVEQYYFLAILVPRLVHDATAYIFYVTHDYNKHHQQPQNFLYRCAARCHVHVFLVLPISSFLLTFVLQSYGDDWVNVISQTLFGTQIRKAVTLGFLGYLALMHYYTEAFTWKQGSPYRQFIAFTR